MIDWNLLSLTLDETRAMANAKGITDEAAVMELHHEADGWAAGLTLLIERFKRTGTDARSISNDTRESVFNYFASLIFDHAPQSTRDTLLSLAFLPHMTPSLAQELSGNSDAGRLLESLRRRHLFTDRRPGPEPVYEFHALFRAFLHAKATELTSKEALLARLCETGVALDQRGEWEAAFHLFVRAEAWDAATIVLLARGSTALYRALADLVAVDRGLPEVAVPIRTLDRVLACLRAHRLLLRRRSRPSSERRNSSQRVKTAGVEY